LILEGCQFKTVNGDLPIRTTTFFAQGAPIGGLRIRF
jgi:hypothetical protein